MTGLDDVEQAYAALNACVQNGGQPQGWLQATNQLERALADLPPPGNSDDLRFLQTTLQRHRELLQEVKEQLVIKQRAVRQHDRLRDRYQSTSVEAKFIDRQS